MAVDAIVTLIQAAPALAKLAANLSATTDAAKRNEQLLEFQRALIGLNSMMASVQQENSALRQQREDALAAIKRFENWEGTKQRYGLASPHEGCVVYALRKALSSGEPAHYLCAACFTKQRLSPLQCREGYHRPGGKGRVLTAFVCADCKSEASTGYMGPVGAKYLDDIEVK